MEAPLAEPGQRLLARIVDTLIVGLPVVIVVRELASGHTVDLVAPPAVAGCMLLYEAIQLALWGRTLGKRFAGIEVIVATPEVTPVIDDAPVAEASGDDEAVDEPEVVPAAQEADAGTLTDRPLAAETVTEMGPSPNAETPPEPRAVRAPETRTEGVPRRLGIFRAVARASIYSLPIAARPIPVVGLLGGVFWVANAGVLYEGTRRQAVHDRLAGTLVVKRQAADSAAF